jgi:NAD(P)-dependent dehydrogenase (short-subunit alcohol dehydrogenase family)
VRGLAARGAAIIVADIDPERAEHTADDVRGLGGDAVAVACDVRDTAQIESAIRFATEKHGRMDILVNNAGGVRSSRFLEQHEKSWRRHLDINLTSALAA